jgi:CMP/dCMP kinase
VGATQSGTPEMHTVRFDGVVALDGPSGTGKSTVARGLAARLGIQYLDTGAMYRAATVAVLNDGVDLADPTAIAQAVAGHRIEVGTQPHASLTRLDGVGVEREIRSAATTAAVSAVSAVPAVREQLVAAQRELISRGPTVAEGRDVGSVVWPDAEVKIYLTASEQVRARRRAGETTDATLDAAVLDDVAKSLRRRDELDSSRAHSPLRQADGALELDTSELSVQQVIDVLVELAFDAVRVGDRG